MKKVKKNNDKFHVSNIVIFVTFFLFIVLIGRLCYLCLFDYKVGDSTISAFIKNRNTEEEVIMPIRGTIFDASGEVLATEVSSYTLIAYLSDKRVDAKGNKEYVEDIDDTSNKLADVLGVDSASIKEILQNGKDNDKYQVEFGNIGKGITEITKEEIDNLNLQGIDFIKDIKRYYPNGDFASYLLGYTVNKDINEHNMITGELGIEEYYNDELSGKLGFITYEKDKYGYKIANGREYIEPAKNGDNIYLTIDSNIELFTENAVKKASADSEAEWVLLVVADAKTGAILGYSSTPSFDPNLRNMTSYIDPLVGYSYEPGSTMKIFSYMCAIDSGRYNGSDTYDSGSKTYTSEVDDSTVTISDWNKIGWGRISYDKGFALSSNIAVANLVESTINKDELRACYEKYGFGKKTGFTLAREEDGNLDFKYQVEVATAGYGQGINTTPIQHIEALTAIANDGEMLKPYVINKIVDEDDKKEIFASEKTSLGNVASTETVEKMKELMRSVITGDNTTSTGYAYYMDGYDLIGKTGTAQIYDYKKGKYMTGDSDNIYSFSGMFPGSDPEIIVYAAIRRPKDTTNYIAPMIKEVEQNITKYLNITDKVKDKEKYNVGSFYNRNVNDVKKELEDNNLRVIVLGSGSRVIDQYPNIDTTIYEDDLVVLKTNESDYVMPNLIGLSHKEVDNLLKLMGVNYEIIGNGYVFEQSIEEGSTVFDNVTVNLRTKYR